MQICLDLARARSIGVSALDLAAANRYLLREASQFSVQLSSGAKFKLEAPLWLRFERVEAPQSSVALILPARKGQTWPKCVWPSGWLAG